MPGQRCGGCLPGGPTGLLDNAPRRPHHTPDEALGTRLATIAELNPDDLTLVTSFIDALVTKTRLKALAGGVS